MEAGKGQLTLLQALARIRDDPWVCWLVGGPQTRAERRYDDRLRRAAVELGLANRVRFLGERADVPRLLRGADVFCHPNQVPEGFGIVFAEALYAGLPVVTTAAGGALEVVDETCGLLTPPAEARPLAIALRRLVRDAGLRSRLGAAGPGRARDRCDPARQLHRLYRLLAAAVQTGPSAGRLATDDHNIVGKGVRPNAG
jgi:glycosyltransferase involved in cell wall biosynthesis